MAYPVGIAMMLGYFVAVFFGLVMCRYFGAYVKSLTTKTLGLFGK